MPLDENALNAMAEASRFSNAQLDRICQRVFGSGLVYISQASLPAEQAKDMVTYAKQYDLLTELAAVFLELGSDKPGVQNLLLGDKMVNQTEDQHSISVNALDIVRLENRVGRVEDRLDAVIQKVESILQRTPLNWSIVAWGIAFAIMAGLIVWYMAAVR